MGMRTYSKIHTSILFMLIIISDAIIYIIYVRKNMTNVQLCFADSIIRHIFLTIYNTVCMSVCVRP